jgi:hypothetical protein
MVLSQIMFSPTVIDNFIKGRMPGEKNRVVDLFDWQGQFYIFLDQLKESHDNREILQEILTIKEDKVWKS